MTGSSDIDTMIIAGARIYFPKNNTLPTPSPDMLTFVVIRDAQTTADYLLLTHQHGRWSLVSPHFFSDVADAITEVTRLAQRLPAEALPNLQISDQSVTPSY